MDSGLIGDFLQIYGLGGAQNGLALSVNSESPAMFGLQPIVTPTQPIANQF
jgi:hypothetical protein